MKNLLCAFAACAVLALATSASAAPALPDKPAVREARNTPIAVETEGTDSIGSKLATRLKESFNASNLFTLSHKDESKIHVLISTSPEFPSRPSVGSAYSIIWLFSQSDGTLRHFLLSEVGVVSGDDVDNLTSKLIERTDGIAARYGYLFQ